MPRRAGLIAMIACLACGTPGARRDGGGDARASADAPSLAPSPPAAPDMSPCPSGWREVRSAGGPTTCEPWPEGGRRTDCAFDEAHFPGTPGCARIGTPCAADGWPSDLPSDRPIVYVDDDAVAGGDGASRESALSSPADALARAPEGAVIALATGRYDEEVWMVGPRQTVWGACVDGTRIVRASFRENWAIIGLNHPGAELRNLGVDTPEPGGVAAHGEGVAMRDVVIRGPRGIGAFFAAGSATLERVVVRDTRGLPDGTSGVGITIQRGARVVLDSVLIEGNREAGLFASSDATIEARDLAVLGARSDAELGSGFGIVAQSAASLVLERLVVEGNRAVGVLLNDGAIMEARDVVLRDTEARELDLRVGRGIDVNTGARATIERGLVERSRDVAMLVSGSSSIALSDVVVRDTLPQAADDAGGRALEANTGAELSLARVWVERAHEAGLLAGGADTRVEASDLTVHDTRERVIDAYYGVGVWAQTGAHIRLTRGAIDGAHLAGIASLTGSQVTLEDVVVTDTAAATCTAASCEDATGGLGMTAHFGGVLRAARFAVRGSALCAVVVGRDDLTATSVDLEQGVIGGSPVGACVQVDGYDTSRLRRDVEYRDVGLPLQATSYSLPDALETN